MDCDMQQQIIRFNRLFKRYDDIYRQSARNFDLPELALWILYVLREKPESTQKDLVDMLLQPKQSIHSALRALVKDEYAVLEHSGNDHRSKQIHLTEKGAILAEATALRYGGRSCGQGSGRPDQRTAEVKTGCQL